MQVGRGPEARRIMKAGVFSRKSTGFIFSIWWRYVLKYWDALIFLFVFATL
jgi:hypothetical protein